MKYMILIQIFLITVFNSNGQEKKLSHQQLDYGYVYVYPECASYDGTNILTDAYPQYPAKEQWVDQLKWMNSIADKIFTKEDIAQLQSEESKYTRVVVYLLLDGNGVIVNASFRFKDEYLSILTDDMLLAYISLLKGKRISIDILPKNDNSNPSRSEWRAVHSLPLYTYSFSYWE